MFIASANFIEKHVDLLDSDPKRFFIELWESEVSQEEAATVADTLQTAGIDILRSQKEAMLQITNHQIDKFATATFSVSAMPLQDFLFGYLYNFAGLSSTSVYTLLLENASLWEDKVKIIHRGEIAVIERI